MKCCSVNYRVRPQTLLKSVVSALAPGLDQDQGTRGLSHLAYLECSVHLRIERKGFQYK